MAEMLGDAMMRAHTEATNVTHAAVRIVNTQDVMRAALLPGLADEIVTSRLLTPQDFQDRQSSFRGAAFSLEPVLTQSAWFRPHNRSEEVDRLYLVGAGPHPGAGLPGVLSSARILDTVVPDAHEILKVA